MPLYNDDINLNDIGEDDIITDVPQSIINDESTDPQIIINNPIEYEEIDFEDTDVACGPGAVIPTIEPPIELDPVGYANMISKTYTVKLTINDYSQTFLEDLYNQGAEFHAVYQDGYDEVVTWQEIADPSASATELVGSEILSVMNAINQHFWIGDDGIHVTELDEPEYLSEHKGHGMLINSYGLLMTNNEFNLVGITQSAITFYDGIGNDSTNITALFGPTTIIGRENKAHIQINFQGFGIYNKDEESIATIKTLNDEDGNLTDTVITHVTTDSDDDIVLNLHDTGYKFRSIISIRTNTDPSNIIWNETISFADYSTPVSDIAIPSSMTELYNALLPYVDDDVVVTIYTDQQYSTYCLGITDSDYKYGLNAFVIGEDNIARGLASMSHGYNNTASGSFSHAEGNSTQAVGVGSHTEGYGCIAQAPYYGTAGYNHAEGFTTKALAIASHSEGCNTKVAKEGEYSHAEGHNTLVGKLVDNGASTTPRYSYKGKASHAEGYNNKVYGDYSHAEGYDCIIEETADVSHVNGIGLVAKSPYTTIIGAYNYNANDGINNIVRDKLFVVGNGYSNTSRSNAMMVYNDGRTWVQELDCNTLTICPYKVGDVYFTTTNYGTTGPTQWSTGFNYKTNQRTFASWTKLTFTAISGVYAYKRTA